MYGAGKYPSRLYTKLAIAFAIVLKGAGQVFSKIPVRTGMQNPPQKN
jgi:hypothetical protein